MFTAVFYSSFILRIITGIRNLRSITPLEENELPDVSLIIPFRNEEENLPGLIRSLANLEYPREKLEILFVDDHSTDNSREILADIVKQENVKLISTNKEGKKLAVDSAVRNAKGEIIVITDADCTHPKKWIKTLVSNFDDQTGFVAGAVMFSAYNSIFDRLQQLEFAGLVISSAGLIGSNQPFSCSAANIAFRKNVFFEVEGYKGNENIPSGDDEFLMQKIAYSTEWKVKYAIGKDVLVTTNTNKNLTEFINQRSRWASKGFNYSNKLLTIQLILIFFYFLLIPVSLVWGVADSKYFLTGALAFIWKIVWDYIAMRFGKKYIFPMLSLRYFLLAELFHIPYILVSSILGTFGFYNWKNRKA